ncbi:unnamed protein product [Polarella glacialis]|uniref:DNA topoisomerase (ATP-hydrolyzing) n=1 Tax=Polarella glacialis TaxID=89957 RepID=A0A813L6F0_POLGL|nr:unnamed protein product [Polarella glacialis]
MAGHSALALLCCLLVIPATLGSEVIDAKNLHADLQEKWWFDWGAVESHATSAAGQLQDHATSAAESAAQLMTDAHADVQNNDMYKQAHATVKGAATHVQNNNIFQSAMNAAKDLQGKIDGIKDDVVKGLASSTGLCDQLRDALHSSQADIKKAISDANVHSMSMDDLSSTGPNCLNIVEAKVRESISNKLPAWLRVQVLAQKAVEYLAAKTSSEGCSSDAGIEGIKSGEMEDRQLSKICPPSRTVYAESVKVGGNSASLSNRPASRPVILSQYSIFGYALFSEHSSGSIGLALPALVLGSAGLAFALKRKLSARREAAALALDEAHRFVIYGWKPALAVSWLQNAIAGDCAPGSSDNSASTYCPILPTVLMNGADGIGVGWSTNIPNYNPREIIRFGFAILKIAWTFDPSPSETAVFLQLGAAITALTGKIETMTVSTQDTQSAIKKIEAKQEEMATNWTLGPYDATWGAQPATKADVVMIVQKSITEIIAPAVMSLTDKLANRCNLITEEIRAMAIRMAWMETDVLKFQQAFQASLKDGKFAKFYKMKDVRTPDEVHRDNLTAEEIKSIEQSGWSWRTEKGIQKPDGTYTPDVSQWWFAEGRYWIGWGSKEHRSKIAKMQAKEEEEKRAAGERGEKRAAEADAEDDAFTGSQGGGPPDKWWTDKFGNTPQFSQFQGVSRGTASSQSAAGVRGGAASSQSAPASFTSSGNQPTPGIPPRQTQAPNTTAQTRKPQQRKKQKPQANPSHPKLPMMQKPRRQQKQKPSRQQYSSYEQEGVYAATCQCRCYEQQMPHPQAEEEESDHSDT